MNPAMYQTGAGMGPQMAVPGMMQGAQMMGTQMMPGAMDPRNTLNRRRGVSEVGFAPSPSRHGGYMTSISQPPSARASPITRNLGSPTHVGVRRGRGHYISRSSNNSPLTIGADPNSSAYGHGFPYYDDPGSPIIDSRPVGQVGQYGPSRVPRVGRGPPLRSYSTGDPLYDGRATTMATDPYMIRDPRERSLDRLDMAAMPRARVRDRSLDRSIYLRDENSYRDAMIDDPYRDPMARSAGLHSGIGAGDPRAAYSRDSMIMELQARLSEVQSQYGHVKRELDATTQKLGSSMHSIKTFWSPELKKERALRKEEAAKYALLSDQLKILRSENQKQSALIRQLEEELRLAHMRNPDQEIQQHIDALYSEKEHMSKEIYLLRETIKELELRIETQKQTLSARDESIKKLMEAMQTKGISGKMMEEERMEMERLRTRNIELETRLRHMENVVESKERDSMKCEELRIDVNKKEQEILAMGAKMKTLEEQHQDYQRHIQMLKESLCAKEEHYNMLHTEVDELRQRLDEKNQLIEKKTQAAMATTSDRNKLTQDLQELRDQVDIKDRKLNVLQRKIENLEDLLKEKDNQLDVARSRLSAMQAHHSTSEGAVSTLEEAINDKDKQIAQLREQRDRAEQERNEDREFHDRELAEYKMKLIAMDSEMEKLQVSCILFRVRGKVLLTLHLNCPSLLHQMHIRHSLNETKNPSKRSYCTFLSL